MNPCICNRCKRKSRNKRIFPKSWAVTCECGYLCDKCYKVLRSIKFDSAEKYKSDIAIFNRNETP